MFTFGSAVLYDTPQDHDDMHLTEFELLHFTFIINVVTGVVN